MAGATMTNRHGAKCETYLPNCLIALELLKFIYTSPAYDLSFRFAYFVLNIYPVISYVFVLRRAISMGSENPGITDKATLYFRNGQSSTFFENSYAIQFIFDFHTKNLPWGEERSKTPENCLT